MQNKYPGPCYHCNKPVPAGEGYAHIRKRQWRCFHKECMAVIQRRHRIKREQNHRRP